MCGNAGKKEYKPQQQTIGNIKIQDMEKDRASIRKNVQGWGNMLILSIKDTNTISTPKLKPIHATFDNKVTWNFSSTLNKDTTLCGE